MFGLCQLHAFADYIRSRLTAEQFDILFRSVLMAAGGVALAAMGILTITGKDTCALMISHLFTKFKFRFISIF